MYINVMVQDQFTEKELNNHSVDEKLIKLVLEGGSSQNVNTDLKSIEKILGGKISPTALDLYRIALTTYVCDLQIKRPKGIESRRFDILISVSNKEKWDTVKTKIEASLGLLTGDTFNFVFCSNGFKGEDIRDEKPIDETKAICLFSGGLDSLAGVVSLINKNINPILISHLSNPFASRAQTLLSSKLNDISGLKLDFFQIRAKPKNKSGLRHKEHSQMSRSFLYLSIAVIFALGKNIPKIYLFENGILAMNIPITNSRIYLNTKTAYPGFIQRFNDVLKSVFDFQPKVQNPFLTLTKSEVISNLDMDGYRDLIRDSISCSETRQMTMKGVKASVANHCGKCYPCILRRISIHNSSLEAFDSNYHVNILDYNNVPTDGQKILLELADFLRRLTRCNTDDEVLDEFPYFYVENEDRSKLIAMYKRYDNEFNKFVSSNSSKGLIQNLHI